MKRIHTPTIDARYWAAITFASVFGTNLGDLYAHTFRLGLPGGLSLLALVAAAVVVAERVDRRPRDTWYWALIVFIRTGATNIADFLAYRLRMPPLLLAGGLAALLALSAFLSTRHRHRAAPAVSAPASMPETNAGYWVAMLAAGVFGTVAGDACSRLAGHGAASIGLAALLGLVLWARRRLDTAGGRLAVGAYWSTVAIARTAGTAIGDWLAGNRFTHLGLPLSTLLTGLGFLAILVLWRPGRRVTVLPSAAPGRVG